MDPQENPRGTRRAALAAGVALLAFLPFARGVLLGHSLYFRDLAVHSFPLRRFLLEGLRSGELRYWNPFVHEGEQCMTLPVSYPLDLLQLLWPREPGLSLVLALHIPLAAVAFLALARRLGAGPLAAAGGSLVYALGGFALSMVNLYFPAQALAWAPLVVLALLRAAEGGLRDVAVAALAVAVSLSTGGAEITLQTLFLGVALVASRQGLAGRGGRTALALLLGGGIAGAALLVVPDLLLGSQRAAGLPTDVVVAHSIHPVTFAQVVVANLHGDLSDITRYWWGQNFFPRGFPYIVSLYLGAPALCLALVGAALGDGPFRGRLVLLGAGASWVCLGRWGGLLPLAEALPPLRALRYPSKAFFTVHFAAALLAAYGLDVLLARSRPSAWRWLAALGLGAGGLLTALPALPRVLPGACAWFLARFFPAGLPWAQRGEDFALMLRDAATGGLLTALLGIVAWAVLTGRAASAGGGLAVLALLGADLLRTGAGLNPMVEPAFFELSPEMSREAVGLRTAGRVFTCDPLESDSFVRLRASLVERRQPHDLLSFAVLRETFSMNFGMGDGIRSAYSLDLSMFVPLSRILPLDQVACRSFGLIAPRLRRAGVARVLSLDPIHDPDLVLLSVEQPGRLRPLSIFVYALRGALPLRLVAREVRTARSASEAEAVASPALDAAWGAVLEDGGPEVRDASGRILELDERPGRLALTAEAEPATAVLIRDPFAPGWSARLNGVPAPVIPSDGGHQAVRIPAGRSAVTLEYTPPHLRPGLLLTGASLVATGLVALWGRRPSGRPSSPPGGAALPHEGPR